jgi:VanZ family protein
MKGVAPRQWLRRAAALGWCAAIFALSAQRDVPGGFLENIPHIDKIVHFLLYAALGALTFNVLRGEGRVSLKRYALILAMVWAAVYGASDEFHQHFVPGRHVELADWLADTLGGAAGAAAWRLRLFIRDRNQRSE